MKYLSVLSTRTTDRRCHGNQFRNAYFSEILYRVLHPTSPSSPTARPPLSIIDEGADDYVIACMNECWKEDPADRPADFRVVSRMLGALQAGL